MPPSREERAEEARHLIRLVERFAIRIVWEAEGQKVPEARLILRLAVGLRRLLDKWRD